MKKLISTIIAVCLLLTAFSTIVTADQTDISINSVTYTSSGAFFNITVNGECEAGNNVSIRIKNKDGDLKALKQFKVKGADTYSYTLKVNTAGDEALTETDGSLVYTVYVRNSDDKSATYSVPLYTEASKLNIIEKFNDADYIGEMIGYINSYKKVFGFDLTYYEGKEEDVAFYMLTKRTHFTLGNIVELFNDSVIRAYLFDEDYTADRTEVIEYPDYDLMLGFGAGFDNTKSLYEDYKDMNSASKAKVNAIAFQKKDAADDFMTLKEKLFMAVVSVVFEENKEDSEDIYEFLKDHNDWLALEELEDLKTYDAYQIISEIAKADIPDKREDFADIYDEVYAEVCKKENVQKPSTGGGSGGGGGGGAAGGISGIVNGKADGVFAPADNITREEFAKILSLAYDLHSEDVSCDFSDVSTDRWSYEYIAVMYSNGIITGYPDGTFKPASFVTREEMAVMLCRVLVRLSLITEEYENYSSYKDYSEISAFAQNSVRTLSNNNILSGDDKGFFNPKNGATRAEVCKMIYNAGL